jgi:hypothetical protein
VTDRQPAAVIGGIDRPHVPDLMTSISMTRTRSPRLTLIAPGLGRHDHLPAPAAKPRTLRHSQPPASSWTRQPAAFPAGEVQ